MSDNRLLLITPDFPPNHGGVARYLSLFADFFAARLTVLTSVSGAAQINTKYIVQEQELLFKNFWPRWLKTVFILFQKRTQYDIALVSHLLPFGTTAWLASFLTKKRYVVILHGLDVRLASQTFMKRFLSRLILRRAHLVVTNSQALAEEVGERFGVSLPLTIYPCLKPLESQKNQQTLDQQHHFLTVGRLISRKGHMHVLMALSQLKQSGRLQNFRYDIVGDGSMLEGLKQLAGELHLSEAIFHGALTDEQTQSLYAQAELFIMPVLDDPLDKEGFGMVFLEAAQHGVPSISSQIPGIDEAILDKETGRLIPSGDLQALAAMIEELTVDHQQRQRLGEQAQTRVQNEFTCEKQFGKLEPYL